MLKIKNLSKNFQSLKALDNISLTLDNHIYGLLGPNGSGKTTFLRILTHVLKGKGDIIWEDNDTTVTFDNLHIGYLPQKFGLYKEMKLKQQMKYFALLKEIPENEIDDEIERVLEAVHMYDELENKCGSFSGGMVRRVGIAQAIMGHPDLVLFDEPTAGLDPEERLRFKSILTQMKGQCPIILSTHIVEDVESVCHEVVVMKKGRVLYKDTLKNLKEEAKNKVIELPLEQYSFLHSKSYYQVKVIDRDDSQYARIICLKNNEYEKNIVEETIEDGYLYILKK